jgi:hypothetical protein
VRPSGRLPAAGMPLVLARNSYSRRLEAHDHIASAPPNTDTKVVTPRARATRSRDTCFNAVGGLDPRLNADGRRGHKAHAFTSPVPTVTAVSGLVMWPMSRREDSPGRPDLSHR